MREKVEAMANGPENGPENGPPRIGPREVWPFYFECL